MSCDLTKVVNNGTPSSDMVCKVASGAAETVPYIAVTNLARIGSRDDVSEIGATSQSRGCHARTPMTVAVFAGMAFPK